MTEQKLLIRTVITNFLKVTSFEHRGHFRNLQRSGIIPVCKDKSKTYFGISSNSPKQFLITITDISSAPVLFFIFREKKASFISFVVRYLSGKVVLAFFKNLLKGLLGVGIFLVRDGPISVKNSLNFLAISFL